MPLEPSSASALSRRAFLGRGLALAGGLAVAGAAGGVFADVATAAPDPKTYFPLVLSSDLYASGLLFGLTHGYDLERSGALANLCAGECISHLGARPAQSLAALAAAEGLL